MSSIESLIESASHDMFNPELNFEIAKKYEELEQTASAVSFYLRAAEYGFDTHPLIVYTSLLRMSICFEDQTGREHTVNNCILQAMEYMPTRPEAYFLLSRFYERSNQWQECYTFAKLGLVYADIEDSLPVFVDYFGKYCLEFEKAVSGWWLGRLEESNYLFQQLISQDIDQEYKNACIYNLKRINPKAVF